MRPPSAELEALVLPASGRQALLQQASPVFLGEPLLTMLRGAAALRRAFAGEKSGEDGSLKILEEKLSVTCAEPDREFTRVATATLLGLSSRRR